MIKKVIYLQHHKQNLVAQFDDNFYWIESKIMIDPKIDGYFAVPIYRINHTSHELRLKK